MAQVLFQRTRVQFPALHGGSQSSVTLVLGAPITKQACSAAVQAGKTPIDIQ